MHLYLLEFLFLFFCSKGWLCHGGKLERPWLILPLASTPLYLCLFCYLLPPPQPHPRQARPALIVSHTHGIGWSKQKPSESKFALRSSPKTQPTTVEYGQAECEGEEVAERSLAGATGHTRTLVLKHCPVILSGAWSACYFCVSEGGNGKRGKEVKDNSPDLDSNKGMAQIGREAGAPVTVN